MEDLYKMLSTADKKGNKTDCHYQSMSIYNDVLTKECIGELTACLNNLCRQYEKLTEDYGKGKVKQAMDELFGLIGGQTKIKPAIHHSILSHIIKRQKTIRQIILHTRLPIRNK